MHWNQIIQYVQFYFVYENIIIFIYVTKKDSYINMNNEICSEIQVLQ